QGNGCFIRINLNNGELIGVSSFGGIYLEDISTLKPTQDGNFVLGGFTRSTTGSEESRPWVVKVNRTGQIIWSKTYNLLGTSLTSRMAEADDGGFVLSMAGDNAFTTGYAIIAKIDASGNFLWAYNYAGGQEVGFGEIKLMPDGGFAALGAGGLLKTDRLGRVSNGCCPAPIAFQVEDYLPPYQNPSMMAEDWENTTPFPMQAVTDVLFTASDYCEFAITSIVQQVLLCEEEFFEINGEFFQAPATVRDTVLNLDGGCDTVRVFNLLQAPQPFQVKTIRFCPGTSVVVDGIEYTEPDAIFQILPAATGCDTLLVTFLELSPLPKKYETTRFCPGDTVFVNGIGYQYPTFFPTPDTLPSSSNGCDTLLFHILAYPSEPSSISANCPPDMLVSTATATPVLVNYAAPSGTSDCTCPDLYFSLTQGIPSGGAFPVGITQVCYSVSDVCGDYETCCFEVKVQEEEACDLKQTACIRYELLGIAADAEQNKTYRVRVTNLCASPLAYTAMQIPNGVEALLPAQNSTYISPNGREYAVRNPSHTPFRSLRFKALGNGIAGGQSDVFEYTLPAQASPVFIRAATRLASGLTYEATLNTFDCVLQAGGGAADRAARKPNMTAGLRLFPNPSSGAVFVDFSAWGEVSVQLRIMNTQGQELTQAQVSTGGTTQPVLIPSTLPDGLYFLEARAENGEKWTAKFVLRR
ncbi:MAG: T9SS type A sorting domain-containing protein, partial [Saprospiraceae bacterium]